MKKLGQLSAMAVLILSLALSTYAGHIDCGYTDPPPDTTATDSSSTVTQAIVTVIVETLSLF